MKKVIALIVAGFAAVSSMTTAGAIVSIQVVAEVGANSDSATPLDLVFVYDASVAGMLPRTGPEWFANKEALIAGLGNAIDIVRLQIPPASQQITVTLPPRHARAVRVLAFADFIAAGGQAAGELTPYRRVTIRLTSASIIYSDN